MNNSAAYHRHRHLSRKRFGQNFLHDKSIINAIVAAINPKPGQAIVEIGPGFGALTKPVAELIEDMTVIEIDHDLVTILARDFFLSSKLEIIHQDAMTVDFAILSAKKRQQLRIFGNLPYNISTPIIFHLFKYIDTIKDIHVMLQQEVVNRMIAGPNSKSYGRLSVMTQYYCKVIPVLKVPPKSFRPIPKVDSALVRILPYTSMPFIVKNMRQLAILTEIAFSQRRKKLRNSLNKLFSPQQLAEHGIDSTLRAENLSVEHYSYLANVLADRNMS